MKLPEPVKIELRHANSGGWLSAIGAFLKDIGVPALAVVVAYFGYQLNKQQEDFKKVESARVQADLRAQIVAQLGERDESKRNLARLRLAVSGEDALPPVLDALGFFDDESVRSGATDFIKFQVSQLGGDARRRSLSSLFDHLRDGNPRQTAGIVQSFVVMEHDLSAAEHSEVEDALKARLGATAEKCAEHDPRFVMQVATYLAGRFSTDAGALLLGVATNCPAGDDYLGARFKALVDLPRVMKGFTAEQRERAAATLEKTKWPQSALVQQSGETIKILRRASR